MDLGAATSVEQQSRAESRIFDRTSSQAKMNLEAKKYRLIQRMIRLRNEGVIDKLESILQEAELEERTEESIQAIEKGQVISLDEFSNRNQEWLKKKATR